MKKKKPSAQLRKKQRLTGRLWLAVFMSWLSLTGLFVYWQFSTSAQTSTTALISVSPSSGTYTRNQDVNFTVDVNINNQYNAVEAYLYYNSDKMRYIDSGLNKSIFNGKDTASATGKDSFGSYVKLYGHRTSGGVTRGKNQLATVKFRMIDNGTANLRPRNLLVVNFVPGGGIYKTQAGNGSYTIKNPASTPSPKPTPKPTPPPAQPSPAISSVSPKSFQGSNKARNLTINGSNFSSNAKVTLRDLRRNRTYANVLVVSRSSRRIIVKSMFAAANANWTAQVINSSSKSSNRYQFKVTAPPAPAPKPSTPKTTTPRRAPKSTSTPRPAPSRQQTTRARPKTVAPRPANPRPVLPRSSSPVSSTDLRLTDVKITQITYRSARLTWQTNRAATSVVSYGPSQDDLAHEKREGGTRTSHSVVISDGLKAGNDYFVRIASSDGSRQVAVTGEFSTKPVPVTIFVADTEDKPVEGATVYAGDQSGVTDSQGEVSVNLSEGSILVVAEKDDLYREIDATVEVPEGDDVPQQRISLNLGAFEAPAPTPTSEESTATEQAEGGSINLAVIIIPIILVMGVAGFVFFILKRRAANQYEYIGDPLEAENYVTPLPSPQPEPQSYQPPHVAPAPSQSPNVTQIPLDTGANIPRHISLPTMLGRYGTSASQGSMSTPTPTPAQQPLDNRPAAQPLVSPTGQPIKQYSSLKDLVNVPSVDQAPPINIPADDLPMSPVSSSEPELVETPDEADEVHSKDLPSERSDENNDDEGSLVIER